MSNVMTNPKSSSQSTKQSTSGPTFRYNPLQPPFDQSADGYDSEHELSSPNCAWRHKYLRSLEQSNNTSMKRESIEHWIVCDACKKWRITSNYTRKLAEKSQAYYCGGRPTHLTTQSINQSNNQLINQSACDKPDDWLIRCVGERGTELLASLDITTIEQLKQSSPGWEQARKRAEKKGFAFDEETQKVYQFLGN